MGTAPECPEVGAGGMAIAVGGPGVRMGEVPKTAVMRWEKAPVARMGVEANVKAAGTARRGIPRDERRTETATASPWPLAGVNRGAGYPCFPRAG